MSTDAVQPTEMRVGYTDVTLSVGGGLGGVVSGGVVQVTELLLADRLPAASTAYAEYVTVRSGSSPGRVKVASGGLTR